MKPTDWTLLVGDGRTMIAPQNAFPGTRPITMTRSMIRRHLDRLLTNGTAQHSVAGSTMWASISFCLAVKRPFEIHVYPDLGYRFELK